jgi:hypothetical protein
MEEPDMHEDEIAHYRARLRFSHEDYIQRKKQIARAEFWRSFFYAVRFTLLGVMFIGVCILSAIQRAGD